MSSNIKRKLAAIMFTDIVSFTKIMGSDESQAIEILQKQQSLFAPILDKHEGNIVKKMGDGMLIEFPSTVEAVECAMEMQDSMLKQLAIQHLMNPLVFQHESPTNYSNWQFVLSN